MDIKRYKDRMMRYMEKLKKGDRAIDKDDIEMMRLKAGSIRIIDIIKRIFNRGLFYYKIEDELMWAYLEDEVVDFLEEFIDMGYLRKEGRWLIWTGGIRWDNCVKFKKSSFYKIAMEVYEN